jgi:class 3 adenylate cyclase
MTSRRRLAAILMADIAGFTRLMASDEERTTVRVVEMHARVRAAIDDHGGRVVSTAGDSVFGLFDSVVEAFECGRRIQEEAAKDQEPLSREERIALRIGLHLGDVIEEGDDVFGAGVNIAARLERMSEPGGMAVSDAVYEQVGSRSELPFEDRGRRSLKGVGRAIRVHTLSAAALGGEEAAAAVRSDESEKVREAVRGAVEAAREARALKRSRPDGYGRGRGAGPKKKSVVAAVFDVGSLTVLAIGLLVLVPQFTDGSPSGLWTVVGGAFVGLAGGMTLTAATGRRGWVSAGLAVGTAVAAWWLGNQIVRAAAWVFAAGMLGTGIEALRRGRSAES